MIEEAFPLSQRRCEKGKGNKFRKVSGCMHAAVLFLRSVFRGASTLSKQIKEKLTTQDSA